MQNKTFKAIFVGDGGVGKSTYVKKMLTGRFSSKYIATLGVEVHPIDFRTSVGEIVFNVWDCAGQEKFGGLRSGYWINAQVAFVFYDASKESRKISSLVEEIKKVCGDIPIFYIATKCDLEEIKSSNEAISISSKENINLELPFLLASRTLLKNNDLFFHGSSKKIKEQIFPTFQEKVIYAIMNNDLTQNSNL